MSEDKGQNAITFAVKQGLVSGALSLAGYLGTSIDSRKDSEAPTVQKGPLDPEAVVVRRMLDVIYAGGCVYPNSKAEPSNLRQLGEGKSVKDLYAKECERRGFEPAFQAPTDETPANALPRRAIYSIAPYSQQKPVVPHQPEDNSKRGLL